MVEHLRMNHYVVSLDVVDGIHQNHSACNDNAQLCNRTLKADCQVYKLKLNQTRRLFNSQKSFTYIVDRKFAKKQ